MSFILEALKKSEQQRQQQNSPSKKVHKRILSLQASPSGSRLSPWLVSGLLLALVSPLLALWVPFVLFSLLILWMYWRVAYVPGGQPIGALERFADNLGKWGRKLVARLNRNRTLGA